MPMPDSLSLPVDAEQLIPHRRPARLVDRLIAYENKSGVVTAFLPGDSPAMDESGHLERVAFIELIAQAYAAVKGYDDMVRGVGVRQGYLVGIRSVQVSGCVEPEVELEVHVRTTAELDDFAIAEGEVIANGKVLASGSLKLWVEG